MGIIQASVVSANSHPSENTARYMLHLSSSKPQSSLLSFLERNIPAMAILVTIKEWLGKYGMCYIQI